MLAADNSWFEELGYRAFSDLFFDRRRDAVTGNRNDRVVCQVTANKCGGMG
jgi:hypothetical protein